MPPFLSRWRPPALAACLLASSVVSAAANAAAAAPATPKAALSDAALLRQLPGFSSHYAEVNGTRLHYVIGGSGQPLLLLPGWPETWWGYRKNMQALARHYTVIVVELRGMGGSARPPGGYDKKTMATDVHALAEQLGFASASVVGHDIGAQVAYAYAANFPQATRKLVLLDTQPASEGMLSLPLLPAHGTFGGKIDPAHPYFWWFAFHQVKGLPEQLLAGRVRLEHEWFYRYMLVQEDAIDARARAVYAHAYDSADAIRASNGWYQAFTQDVIDDRGYAPLPMPVLGLGGSGHERLKAALARKASNFTAIKIEQSGHFVQEEQPGQVNRALLDFLDAP